jgi:hypothetical protein
VASTAVALGAPQGAAAAVQQLGARADATTIDPLAIVAWPALAKPLLTDPNTRAWSSVIAIAHRERVAQMIAIAEASGEDPARLVAIAALGRIGGEEAKASLEKVHADKSQPDVVRLAAWKALKRLLRRGGKTYGENEDKGPGGSGGSGGGGGSSSSDEDDGGDGGGDDDGDDDDGGGDDGASASADDDEDSDDEDGDDEDSDDDDSDDDDGDEDDDDGETAGGDATHGDGVVEKLNIQRSDDYMYYVKGDGVYRIARKKPGAPMAKAEKLAPITTVLDYSKFLYYVNQNGDLAAKSRQVSAAGDDDDDEGDDE